MNVLLPGLVEESDILLDEIDNLVSETENTYTELIIDNSIKDLALLGKQLFQWLDGDDKCRFSNAVVSQAISLYLDFKDLPGLRRLPWELLWHNGIFLAENEFRPFTPVRVVSTIKYAFIRENRPLRILFMVASPEDQNPVLNFEAEEKMILEATSENSLPVSSSFNNTTCFGDSPGFKIELVVEESGSLKGLVDCMKAYPPAYFDVFHLTGHADVLDDEEPIFALEDDCGFTHLASAADLAKAFGGIWPKLIFLSGCKTGMEAGQGYLPSLCEALVEAGAPAVLGWALPVEEKSAGFAAASLYGSLSAGQRIDEAVAHARRKLLQENSPYWSLLRLYANATPLAEPVTCPGTAGRHKIKAMPVHDVFLDARNQVPVCPREKFIGRRRVIQRCMRAIKSVKKDDNYFDGVLLYGMGGLGKSSLAARLCDRMHDYKIIVLSGRIDEQSFWLGVKESLLKSPSDTSKTSSLVDKETSIKLRLQQLFDIILAGCPALFVLDDFEKNLEPDGNGAFKLMSGIDAILAELLTSNRNANNGSSVVVTSRYRFNPPGSFNLYEESLESLKGILGFVHTTLLFLENKLFH